MTGSRARANRRHAERAMKKAGVAVVVRAIVPTPSALHITVDAVLDELAKAGGDLNGRVVLTIGHDHPMFPGRHVVEAKAESKLELYHGRKLDSRDEEHPDDCPGCPVDHSLGD